VPAGEVQAGGGLVEEQDRGFGDQAQREVELAPHSAGVGLDGLLPGATEVEDVEQPGRALAHHRPGQAVQAAEHRQVLRAGQLAVDREGLAGQADAGLDALWLTRHVIAADPGCARVGAQQGGEDADHGGLARAVRPEEGGHRPGAGLEADVGQGRGLAVALGQADRDDRRLAGFHQAPVLIRMSYE
jgi:hypothetical protein